LYDPFAQAAETATCFYPDEVHFSKVKLYSFVRHVITSVGRVPLASSSKGFPKTHGGFHRLTKHAASVLERVYADWHPQFGALRIEARLELTLSELQSPAFWARVTNFLSVGGVNSYVHHRYSEGGSITLPELRVVGLPVAPYLLQGHHFLRLMQNYLRGDVSAASRAKADIEHQFLFAWLLQCIGLITSRWGKELSITLRKHPQLWAHVNIVRAKFRYAAASTATCDALHRQTGSEASSSDHSAGESDAASDAEAAAQHSLLNYRQSSTLKAATRVETRAFAGGDSLPQVKPVVQDVDLQSALDSPEVQAQFKTFEARVQFTVSPSLSKKAGAVQHQLLGVRKLGYEFAASVGCCLKHGFACAVLCRSVMCSSKYTPLECFASLVAIHVSKGLLPSAFDWTQYATLAATGSERARSVQLSETHEGLVADVLARALFVPCQKLNSNFRMSRNTTIGNVSINSWRLRARPGFAFTKSAFALSSSRYTRVELAVRAVFHAADLGCDWTTLLKCTDDAASTRKPASSNHRRSTKNRGRSTAKTVLIVQVREAHPRAAKANKKLAAGRKPTSGKRGGKK
jgi:hypothetical protein